MYSLTLKADCLERVMIDKDGADVKPSKPFFICVEAKRWQAFGIDASTAQLLAQIRALQISRLVISFTSAVLINSNDKGRTGALSDGLHWAIWHNYDRQWYIADFTAHSMEDSFTLLSQSRFHLFLC